MALEWQMPQLTPLCPEFSGLMSIECPSKNQQSQRMKRSYHESKFRSPKKNNRPIVLHTNKHITEVFPGFEGQGEPLRWPWSRILARVRARGCAGAEAFGWTCWRSRPKTTFDCNCVIDLVYKCINKSCAVIVYIHVHSACGHDSQT